MAGKGQDKDKPKKLAFSFLVRKLLGGTLDHYANELTQSRGLVSGWLFDRFFRQLRLDPEKVEKLRYFAKKGRLIYALPYRSPLDFLFFNLRLRYEGLPVPSIAYNMNVYRFQPVGRILKIGLARLIHVINFGVWPNPFRNKYYLKRYREGAGFVLSLEDPATFAQRLIYPIHDPLYHLIKLHRKHDETVVIIPIFTVFEKGPLREEKNIWDIFIGPKDRPGRLRKIVHYVRYFGQAFVEVGDPITIDMFLARADQQGLTDEEVAFNLRKELWEHATREQKVIRGPKLKPRTQIMESVLRDPEIVKIMRQESKRRQKPFHSVRKEAAKYVDEIAANYSQSTIEFLDRVLGWAWHNLYDGMLVDEEGLARVKEASKRYPVVYVPSHKSHIDYLVLSWVFYNHNIVPPHIAAGVNLNTWPIGGIFRKAGAFFMRRTFRGNDLYAAAFVKYLEVLVREGHNIEFFIEGGRSRTGRLLAPKLGMVKYVLEAFEHGAAKDIMFVPVYIGYDQILEEGEYLEEMSGVKNPKGNFIEMLRNRNLIKKRYGRIYVNFAPPVSLREHLESMSDRVKDKEPGEARELVVEEMAGRIIQGINRQQVVTPFALMAAALLTSPAKAINRDDLLNALALYYQYLEFVKARFAGTLDNFPKAMEDVISYYENRGLIEVEAGGEDAMDELAEPMYTLPEDHRLSLEMYKNMILHHFTPISFVTLSLLSADYGECLERKILEDYRFLKDLFAFDFIYDERQTDNEKIERCLTFLQNGRHLELNAVNGQRMAKVTPKGREEMVYFAALLTNFLEAYGIVLNSMPALHKKPQTRKEFLQKLRGIGQRLYKQGQVLRPEALSMLLFENALKMAKGNGMINTEPTEGKYPILTFNPSADDLRNQMLTHVSKFIRVEKYHYLEK
ncbi:MAG TPA: 1-acyl-sn-glycerol-3-phosphate acyltransferase [bacterium]|nr:1-acyl-sn-glycerol-3-phosphate acyltransferase [bacterium]